MLAIIGAKLLASKESQPKSKPYEIRDRRLPGFVLRVQPSGVRSYIAQIRRGQRVTLGKVGELLPEEARERCQRVLGNVAHGRAPRHGIDGAETTTLGEFIDDTYDPWLRANRPKSAVKSLARLQTCFGKWRSLPIGEITAARIESWKLDRLKAGKTPATVLRDVMTLSGVLSRAVRMSKLDDNPIRKVDKPRIDRAPKVRFLTAVEERALLNALAQRDAEMIAARDSANKWRKERKHDLLPRLPYYGDHLTPAVLTSLHTGLRRGELLALNWSSIDFKNKHLTIEGRTAKTGNTRHIPLNETVLEVFRRWHEQQAAQGTRVFPIATGFKSAWGALLDRAQITSFRWHDMRHHFASRLVQAGVALNTVRELLGHGSMAMTLRYAHLSPDQKREAVAWLMEPREGAPKE